MAALGNYLDAASAAVRARDGATLARLLDVTNSDASRAVTSCLAENREVNLGSLCQQKLPQPYDEVFAHHCQCLGAIGEGRFEDAFAAVTATTQAFVKDFKLQETAWSLDALVHVVKARLSLAPLYHVPPASAIARTIPFPVYSNTSRDTLPCLLNHVTTD
jgi:hypothetical protein